MKALNDIIKDNNLLLCFNTMQFNGDTLSLYVFNSRIAIKNVFLNLCKFANRLRCMQKKKKGENEEEYIRSASQKYQQSGMRFIARNVPRSIYLTVPKSMRESYIR